MISTRTYAILHIGRCGSTVLSSLLNQQEGVRNAGEVLEQQYEKHRAQNPMVSPWDFLMEIAGRRQESLRAFSIELKCVSGTHLDQVDPDPDRALARLAGLGIDRFVLLHRSNLLDRILSQRVAIVRGSYVRKEGDDTPPTTVKLNIRQVFLGKRAYGLPEAIDALQADVLRLRESLVKSGYDFIELDYDGDINPDPLIGLKKIADFVGFPVTSRNVVLRKVVTAPKSEVITNMDEVRAALAGTGHEWMAD
jgi:hypothetical protein